MIESTRLHCTSSGRLRTQCKTKRRVIVRHLYEVSKDDVTDVCHVLQEESQLLCHDTLHSYPTLDIAFNTDEFPITLEDIIKFLRPSKTYIWDNRIFHTESIIHTTDARCE